MKILVTGSIAYDLLLHYEGSFPDSIDPQSLQSLSLAFVTPRFARHHGGTGANIAWNLKLLNQDPLLAGTVGNDGGAYLALLKERGIGTEYVQQVASHVTSTAIVATDNQEHQITFYHPGADAHGTWPDLADRREELVCAIVSPRDAQAMEQAMQWCETYKLPYIFDPGQQVQSFGDQELMRAIQSSAGVITNAYEWSLLSARTSLSTDAILEHVPFLVITYGEQGLTIFTKKSPIVIPPCKPDRVVNPTGAGDALRAGFLTGLGAGWDLAQCGRLGASLASFVVEQEGTLLDHLDMNDVLSRAEVAYGEMLPELP